MLPSEHFFDWGRCSLVRNPCFSWFVSSLFDRCKASLCLTLQMATYISSLFAQSNSMPFIHFSLLFEYLNLILLECRTRTRQQYCSAFVAGSTTTLISPNSFVIIFAFTLFSCGLAVSSSSLIVQQKIFLLCLHCLISYS